jgi:flagellar biosynthesis/type III secretory pathway M-ring protein FliF/YscJ
MSFWVWIWIALVLVATVTLGIIAKSLLNRAESAAHQALRLADQANRLTAALESKPTLESPGDSILADPIALQARRRALQKAKVKKQQQRQRRLIASLKRFDPNESRFH